ncbi:ABC transporter permease [Paenibacillus caui]|uniref:ABC transporter permease n=1 Tax=Paenibacillus caui TaxID=2873927 RepID=UPI001CA9FC9F|nr:ABC transporter permease [Paenibacillus caui]
MKAFFRVLSAERLKMSKSYLWLIVLASPVLAALIGMLVSSELAEWPLLLGGMSLFHAMLFLPVMTGLFSSFICRYEHTGGGWKSLLALPVSRTAVYLAKFTVVICLLALTQILLLGAILITGRIIHISSPIPWHMLLQSILGGWVACLPLAALQMFASLRWASFAAPLVVNVIFTIPNILITNSATYGPYYPWAQPFLAMMPKGMNGYDFGAFNLPFESLMITVLGGFVLFFASGLVYFNRKEV